MLATRKIAHGDRCGFAARGSSARWRAEAGPGDRSSSGTSFSAEPAPATNAAACGIFMVLRLAANIVIDIFWPEALAPRHVDGVQLARLRSRGRRRGERSAGTSP